MMTAATASSATEPIRAYIILLLLPRAAVGTMTAGSEKPPPPNTGRSSIEPMPDEAVAVLFAAPEPPR